MANEPTAVPLSPQDELRILYTDKGELVTQLELGQNKLMQINQRLNILLGIGLQQPR